ncbi:MAG: hypothetical protein AB7L18_10725, partial [Hyphomicrobiaceae bacterium]
MRSETGKFLAISATLSALAVLTVPADAQTAGRDRIADLLARTGGALIATPAAAEPATMDGAEKAATDSPAAAAVPDPREGDAQYEQARRLMSAIDAVLR